MRENKDDKNWYVPALVFYAKVTGWIVVPLLVGYLLTHSLIGILVAFLITMYGIYREIKVYKMTLTDVTDFETKDKDFPSLDKEGPTR